VKREPLEEYPMATRLTTALTAAAAVAMLAGCGANPALPSAQARAAAAAEAQATKTLKDGFKHVYGAAFAKCDANADGNIDEYEAGPFIDLRDFARADENKNGKLTNKEFLAWANRGWIFGLFAQDADGFFKSQRKSLLKAFDRLDADKNRVLSQQELNDGALTGAKLTLTLSGLKTKVALTTATEEAFAAADKTEDGALSQGEFEDFALDGWISLINPKYTPAPEPNPPAPAPQP
jgi:Ca2+-binding EF-hand superfamily protein